MFRRDEQARVATGPGDLRFGIVTLMAFLVLPTISPNQAQADIIIDHGTVIPIHDPSYRYSFDTVLTNSPNPPGVEIVSGDFFTVYDLKGIILGTNLQPDNWAATFSLTGQTPTGQTPTDSSSIYNVTWTYIGGDPILAPQDLGIFSVQSMNGSLTNLVYSGQDTLLGGGTNGNTGSVPITAVPEPTSMALVVVGISAIWASSRRRRPAKDRSPRAWTRIRRS